MEIPEILDVAYLLSSSVPPIPDATALVANVLGDTCSASGSGGA